MPPVKVDLNYIRSSSGGFVKFLTSKVMGNPSSLQLYYLLIGSHTKFYCTGWAHAIENGIRKSIPQIMLEIKAYFLCNYPQLVSQHKPKNMMTVT